jgi:hypothetical protein
MKTLIGHVELIEVNGEVKCGGAVVKIKEMLKDVSFQSMNVKMMRKKKKIKMILQELK